MVTPARWLGCLVLVAFTAACASVVDAGIPSDPPAFHAHRAAFGSDTSTVDPGTAEIEFGVTALPEEDFVDTPLTVKWGADERTELFAGLSPYQYQSRQSVQGDAQGFGDMALGVRHRFHDQDGLPSMALQLATKLPTGSEADGLSSGAVDFLGAGILTQDFGRGSATAYYELGMIGKPGGGTELVHSMALITELTVGRDCGLFGEAALILAPDRSSEAVFAGVGVSFNLAERLAWDAGAKVGLTDDAPELQLFFGFTLGLGRSPDHRH